MTKIRSCRPCGALAAVLVASLCLATGASAQARNPHLARGVKLLEQAQDEDALRELKEALAWRKSPPLERATIHLFLGVTYFNLLDEARSARHFRKAFTLDPRVELPANASPKLVRFVEQIRAEQRSGPQSAPGVTRLAPPDESLHPPISPRPPGSSRDEVRPRTVNWPAWITLAAGVAVGGTGLALGLVARQRAEEANELSLPYFEAQSRRDSAESLALAANILFGVAGAAAVTSGVLFIVGHRQSAPVASVAPVRGGVWVHLGGITW